MLDQDIASPGPDRLTVDDQVTALNLPEPRPDSASSGLPRTRTAVTVWEPQTLLGRWEARIRVLPGDDPDAVVGMDLAPATGPTVQDPHPSLDSRTVTLTQESDVPTAGWHHWAVERTASSTRFYLDGRLLTDTPSDPSEVGPVQLRWWIQSADETARTPARAEAEWVAFYAGEGS